MEIYVSSGCVKSSDLVETIETLRRWGINNVELTGGVNRQSYKSFLDRLHLYEDMSFQCHNYFPPPDKAFVLNLSASGRILKQSIELIDEALEFSAKTNAKRYGVHAGFRVLPQVSELGKIFGKRRLLDREDAEIAMMKHYSQIQEKSSIDIFIENNVFSSSNFNSFSGENPFLLCCSEDYYRLNRKFNFNLLLDTGHLKVSSNTLNLNFEEELSNLLLLSKYIHVSDNRGEADDNLPLQKDSELFCILKNMRKELKDKAYTVEVYTGKEDVLKTVELINSL